MLHSRVCSNRSKENGLTEEHTNRLLAALKTCPLKGLSKLEHAHLALLVQNVFEVRALLPVFERYDSDLDVRTLRYRFSRRGILSILMVCAISSRCGRTTFIQRRLLPPRFSPRLESNIEICCGRIIVKVKISFSTRVSELVLAVN